jgi:galactose oxidase-like protein
MARLLWQQRQDIGPAARRGAAMAFMAATERVLLWGGLGEQTFLNDTWEWDGDGWIQVADTGPSPVEGAGLAYDSLRNVAVLFTSDANSTVWETWEWDGEGWTQVEDTGPQASNYVFGMTYDGARQVTVLEGGAVNGAGGSFPAPVGTWAWDGSAWTQVADVGPSQRVATALAYDASRERVVFFGGLSFTATTQTHERDTWEWDGNTWEQVTNMGPPPRYAHAMTGTAAASLLFGGVRTEGSIQQVYQDTWTWDGSYWHQRQDMGPSPRYVPALSWDAARQRAVLFGGSNLTPTPQLGDTWESLERP